MKSVYTGGEKVGEFESYDEFRVGDNKPAFIYEGNELVYPNPVKDGLVLWYDFSGRTNTDGQRGIAEDLSGNGNHGTLQNFNYTAESGYDKNKLLFDGVDDQVFIEGGEDSSVFTILMTLKTSTKAIQFFNYFSNQATYIRKLNTQLHASVFSESTGQATISFGGVFSNESDTHTTVGLISDGARVGIIANGNVVREIEINDMRPVRLRYLGRWVSHADALDGYYNSLQVYNRPLTPEEIAHNYAIEKERFGIE